MSAVAYSDYFFPTADRADLDDEPNARGLFGKTKKKKSSKSAASSSAAAGNSAIQSPLRAHPRASLVVPSPLGGSGPTTGVMTMVTTPTGLPLSASGVMSSPIPGSYTGGPNFAGINTAASSSGGTLTVSSQSPMNQARKRSVDEGASTTTPRRVRSGDRKDGKDGDGEVSTTASGQINYFKYIRISALDFRVTKSLLRCSSNLVKSFVLTRSQQ
jgi:hypothetical protein